MSDEDRPAYARRVADPSSDQYAVHHAGRQPTEKRESIFGDTVGEFFGEMIFSGISLALFAGLSAAVIFGWHHNKPLVIGIGVTVFAFLAYGTAHLVRAARGSQKPRWPRIATVGAVTVVVVALWALTVFVYR